MSFAKNMGRKIGKNICKNISCIKYSEKLLDQYKKSSTVALKTALERAIQKTAEATGDLTGIKNGNKNHKGLKNFTTEKFRNSHK